MAFKNQLIRPQRGNSVQAELKVPIPKIPEVFMKPAGCLNNPLDPIQLPACAPDAVDAEVELAVIIGQDCKNVNAESALEYVLGYTIANDITARDMQSHTSQWVYCKGYDSFCPLVPVVVSACSVPDPSVLSMRTTLDGEVLQDSNTSQMIFSIAEIVSHLSKVWLTRPANLQASLQLRVPTLTDEQDTTLPKGTVILTGTPSGVGHGHIPPRYLRPGSMVYCYIGSGLGTLVNSVELRRS